MRMKIKMRFSLQKEKKDMCEKFHGEPMGKTVTIDRLGGELMDTADVLQVFDEASTKGRFNKKSAVGISEKDEKIAGDPHGDEFDSACNARVPEEGGA